MGTGERTCERDGVQTQLTCVECASPICPACLVRTPVGLKCPECTGAASKSRRRSIPVPAVVAVLLLPVLVWLALGGSGSDSGSTPEEDTAGQLEAIDSAARSRIGEEVRSGPFTFKVTRAECVGREIGVEPATRVAQGRFCLVYLTVRNEESGPEVYPGPAQLVADSSARRYHPGVMESGPPPPPLVTSSGVKEITTVRLNPGAAVEGVLIFDMPVDTRPAEFEFHHGPRSMGATVRLDTLAS